MKSDFSYGNFYLDYLSIDRDSFYEKISFYKKYSESLDVLSFYQRIEIKVDYAFCLFEVGSYYNYLSEVDYLVETVIIEDITAINGKDVFYELLLRKAACYYNIGHNEKSLSLARQLLNIDNNPSTRLLYYRCRSKELRNQLDWLRATIMVFLLSGISLTIANILYFKPFYQEASFILVSLRNMLMVLSLTGLIGYEIYIRTRIIKETHNDSIRKAIRNTTNQVMERIKSK